MPRTVRKRRVGSKIGQKMPKTLTSGQCKQQCRLHCVPLPACQQGRTVGLIISSNINLTIRCQFVAVAVS
jgi:hypothetical protein